MGACAHETVPQESQILPENDVLHLRKDSSNMFKHSHDSNAKHSSRSQIFPVHVVFRLEVQDLQ